MAYTNTFDISGQTGKIGIIRYGGDITFQQLFTGSPQYYPGSIIQVQEILTVYTSIVSPASVDIDLGWFDPKKYLGTYQIINNNGITAHREGDDDFLVGTVQEIAKYSWYTITANPDVPIALADGFIVEDCNFYIQPEVFLFPNNPAPVAGFRLHESGDGKPVLRGYNSLSKANLADTKFNNLINGVGLCLNQGVEGVRVDYNAAIINDIYVANQPFPVSTCELASPSCLEQFNAYLAIQEVATYASESECLTANGGPCANVNQWICPTDPSQVFDGWVQI